MEKKPFKGSPFFFLLLNWIGGVLALYIPNFTEDWIKTSFVIRSIAQFVKWPRHGYEWLWDSVLKWPHIFISTSRQQCRETGSKSLGLSASTLMYHTALWVLTVQLGALLRPSLSVGKTRRETDKIKSCFLKHTSVAGAIHLPDCDWWGGQGAGPLQKLGLVQKAAQVGPFIPISQTKNE